MLANDSFLSKEIDNGLRILLEKILAPEPSVDPLMLGGQSIDNVAWVDFTDVRFAIDPHENPAVPSHAPFVGPDSDDLIKAADVEDEGGDSDRYLAFVQQMQASLQAELVNLFQSHLDMVFLNKGYPTTSDFPSCIGDFEYSYSYDPATGILQLNLTLPGIQIGATLFYNMPLLAQWTVKAATESMALIADLMSIYDSVAASGMAVDDFWANLRDLMTNRLNPDINIVVCHYMKFYNDITGSPTVIKESSCFEMSRMCHWPFALSNLKTIFNAQILAGLYKAPPVPADHNFVTFKPYSINCGLRLVYRQTWRQLGNQRGEVVRTIPLGPKQTEKVSTKILRRVKFSKSAEDLNSTERTTETSEAAKDSSEIMREASFSMNMSYCTSAEGGVEIGVFSGKASNQFGGGMENAEKSGDKQAQLTEKMQKVASKMRQESKVVVSTESEESFELATASEITNPNDEIAITYVYSKLQRQFQVLTELAELQDVIMVAEPLPRPKDISAKWVRRYDWIISKVLLDNSYRDVLNSISQDPDVDVRKEIAEEFKTVMEDTVAGLKSLGQLSVQVSQVDFVAESQKNYRETAEGRYRDYVLQAQRERLFQHIRDNVLHYCRAIYAQEDLQQRALRHKYHNVRIPLDWKPRILRTNLPGRFWIQWTAVPSAEGGRWIDIGDAINPAGPIGYFGNYAMYYIRPELRDMACDRSRPPASASIFQLLDTYKRPYLAPVVDTNGNPIPGQYDENVVMDPVLIELIKNNQPASVRDNELTDDIVKEMSSVVPGLRLLVAEKKHKDPETAPDYITDKNVLKKYYAKYLFLKKQSRLCVIDTNCLMIDLLAGDGSMLEPFKLAHRGMDVLKAREETRKIERENKRRKALLNKHIYGDPDIEKVVEIRNEKPSVDAIVVEETSDEE